MKKVKPEVIRDWYRKLGEYIDSVSDRYDDREHIVEQVAWSPLYGYVILHKICDDTFPFRSLCCKIHDPGKGPSTCNPNTGKWNHHLGNMGARDTAATNDKFLNKLKSLMESAALRKPSGDQLAEFQRLEKEASDRFAKAIGSIFLGIKQ